MPPGSDLPVATGGTGGKCRSGARVGAAAAPLDDLLGLTLGLQAWIARWLVVAETAAARPRGAAREDLLDRRALELTADREAARSAAAG
jgi:hypothetical protein